MTKKFSTYFAITKINVEQKIKIYSNFVDRKGEKKAPTNHSRIRIKHFLRY